jgi:activating signal cointegrator complex subunit 1
LCTLPGLATHCTPALPPPTSRSLDYNYFLCLPLANPDTCARFEAFRAAGLAEPGAAAAGACLARLRWPLHRASRDSGRTSLGLLAAVIALPSACHIPFAGLEEYVFMHPKHLHLTIAMLKLYRHVAPAAAAMCIPLVAATA